MWRRYYHWGSQRISTVCLHYLWVPYLQIFLLTKIYLQAQINPLGTLVIHRAQGSEKPDFSNLHIPSWGKQGDALLLMSALYAVNKFPFCNLVSITSFTFCAVYWWFYCLKWPVIVLLKCNLVFLSTSSCDMPYRGNVLDELCSGMSYSVVGCGFNVNEPLMHV